MLSRIKADYLKIKIFLTNVSGTSTAIVPWKIILQLKKISLLCLKEFGNFLCDVTAQAMKSKDSQCIQIKKDYSFADNHTWCKSVLN